MSQFEENCFVIFQTNLRQYLVRKSGYTEVELFAMIEKMEKIQETFLMASMNVVVAALQADNGKFQAETLTSKAIEFRFLYEFTNTIRDAYGEVRTKREVMEQYGKPTDPEVPA